MVTPGVTAYAYDTRDRLLTENATSYAYDANGNVLTKSGDAAYTWDTENRLVRIVKVDGTLIEHAYDPDGARIRTKTTPPASPTQTTNFLVDTSGGLSHVVAEFGEAGVQTAYYLRALDDLLAVIRPTGTRYYHADGIGSIRKLTDETGAVTDSYEYTAFGEQYEHVGTDPQPYSFAGEPLDPNTGFQYHRARWMQPSTGRFAGMDPWEGNPFKPNTLARYIYAGASPVLRTDPSGLFEGLASLSVTSGARVSIAASAVLSYALILQAGVSPLQTFDIDTYGNFNTKTRRRDGFVGHELLQNQWLIVNGYTRVRAVGYASRENPAIALPVKIHQIINTMQRAAGLYDSTRLGIMTGEENIAENAAIAMRAGVFGPAVGQLQITSLLHLDTIKAMRSRGEPTW